MKIVCFEQDCLHTDMPDGTLDQDYVARFIAGESKWWFEDDEDGNEVLMVEEICNGEPWTEQYTVCEQLDEDGMVIYQAFNEGGESTKFIGTC